MNDDWDLLASFAETREQDAFAELVRRHVRLVHGTAQRLLGPSISSADDVTQAVFLLLSQKSGTIRRHGALAGWLYRATHYCCANVRKMERRREVHEREAAMRPLSEASPWEEMRPLLDEGLAHLGDMERQAILARYLEERTTAETAQALGISAEAVQKRLERGLARLRKFFGKRGCMLAASALVSGLAAEAKASIVPPVLMTNLVSGAPASATIAMIAAGAARTLWLAQFKIPAAVAAVCLLAAGISAFLWRSPAPAIPAAVTMPAPGALTAGTRHPLQAPVHGLLTLPDENVDAPALVREVRQKEKWVETVASLQLMARTHSSNSQHAMDQNMAELKEQFPGFTPTRERFPELFVDIDSTIELAFDQHRVFSRHNSPLQEDDVRIWDGTRGLWHEKYFSDPQEQFGIRKDSDHLRFIWSNLSWPRADVNGWHMWWDMPQAPDEPVIAEPAEDFKYKGRQSFAGIDCYVVSLKGPNLTRMHIGVQDHLLHELETGQMTGSPAAFIAFAAEAHKRGVELKSEDDIGPWVERLSEAEKKAIDAAVQPAIKEGTSPIFSHWMLDYAQVAPGCWVPKRQGYLMYATGSDKNGKVTPEQFAHPFVDWRTDIVVTDVKVGEPLPDALFTLAFTEGVQVFDTAHDPPLFYPYKKDRTPEEWDRIVQNTQQQKARDEKAKAAQNALIGKPAPAFPETQWLNSDALTWAQLQGRWVIVDFFAEWCGPCRNDLPALVRGHNARQKDDAVIIGIHAQGSKLADIQRLMDEFKITYPICIDVPGKERASWGALFDEFHVGYIPFAVLVDPDGNIAALGSLGEVSVQLGKLRRSPTMPPAGGSATTLP